MALIMLVLLAGCDQPAQVQTIDFARTTPVARPGQEEGAPRQLRMAVAAMTSPQETFHNYQELTEYIGRRLGLPASLAQRKTYAEIDQMLARGELDVAFVCSGPYAAQGETPAFELLAAPVVGGQTTYRAYLIVGRDSPHQSLEDLRGKVFAFTDPDSNTGRLVPQAWLAAMGQRPETFFAQTIYTYSHDSSIQAVARGLVDGAAVDGLVWDFLARRRPELADRTRVIRVSEPYGIPPVVAGAALAAEQKAAVKAALLAMADDPQGRRILDALMIDGFVAARSQWYDSIRRLREGLHAAVVQP
ncbi:MAG: phosphate/phosphite/phosphonate ABC transporter substrate-binding protein [Thermodesulfobacteriota bacterium]